MIILLLNSDTFVLQKVAIELKNLIQDNHEGIHYFSSWTFAIFSGKKVNTSNTKKVLAVTFIFSEVVVQSVLRIRCSCEFFEISKNTFSHRTSLLAASVFYETEHKKQPPECSVKKGVLRNFAKLTGKHLCHSILIKLQASVTWLKKILLHRSFPVNFAKFLRTPFYTEHVRWLLLIF